jgi:hypothetical protein
MILRDPSEVANAVAAYQLFKYLFYNARKAPAVPCRARASRRPALGQISSPSKAQAGASRIALSRVEANAPFWTRCHDKS